MAITFTKQVVVRQISGNYSKANVHFYALGDGSGGAITCTFPASDFMSDSDYAVYNGVITALQDNASTDEFSLHTTTAWWSQIASIGAFSQKVYLAGAYNGSWQVMIDHQIPSSYASLDKARHRPFHLGFPIATIGVSSFTLTHSPNTNGKNYYYSFQFDIYKGMKDRIPNLG